MARRRTLAAGLWLAAAVALAMPVARSIWWPAAAGSAAGFEALAWPTLVPAGWTPEPVAEAATIAAMGDQDPRAQALLAQMRQQLDDAPANAQLDGGRVRMAGYVVPLDSDREGLREFLLVPYHGACIHVPPPPANQIVHVVLQRSAPGFRTMDAVRVHGVLEVRRSESASGHAAYRMSGLAVEPLNPSLGE